ncbi:MAG TPA: hypothetical protein VK470_09645 [Bacteroidota bacterium]|nr:hypothetical protein [Bacteroidota bacterium]
MKTIVKSFFFLIVCAQWTFANNGSAYSRYGAGEPSLFSTSRAAALGGAGTALSADGYVNLINPASLGTVTRTLFNGAYQYRGYRANDGTNSSYLNAGGFLSAAMAFPVYRPYGIVFAFGLSPVSTIGYHFDLIESSSIGTIEQIFDGRGGLTAANLALSYSPMTDLFLGATADYTFGTITQEQTLSYPNTTYFASDIVRTMSPHGFTFRFGALHTGIDKALGLSTTKHLSLGLTLSTGGSLTTEAEELRRSTYSTQVALDSTIARPNGTMDLPFGATFGLAYQNSGKLYTAEVQMQQWGDFKELGVHPAELQNSLRAGAGIEWLPTRDYTTESYWAQVSLRLGAYAQQTQVRVHGTSINEYFGTAGIGLPLGNDARLNLGLEYGVRGTTSSSLIKDNIIRFTLSISAGDTWFIQPEVE